MSKPVSIWLIEDNANFSSIVVRLLNDVPDFDCSHAFSSAEAALKMLKQSKPDVILLDVDLPGINGITAIREIKSLAPGTSVVMLTVFNDQKKIYEAIGAGASGYLLKTASEEEIAEAVRLAVKGGAPVDPQVAGSVWQMLAKMTGQANDYGLTPRETEILQDAAQGLANKEIATRRSMSTHTVDAHLRRIYQKLGVHTRTAAVALALRHQLV